MLTPMWQDGTTATLMFMAYERPFRGKGVMSYHYLINYGLIQLTLGSLLCIYNIHIYIYIYIYIYIRNVYLRM